MQIPKSEFLSRQMSHIRLTVAVLCLELLNSMTEDINSALFLFLLEAALAPSLSIDTCRIVLLR